MIAFRHRTLWERLLRLIPSRRKQQDAALHEAIRRLVADPSLPCEIGGVVIPNGYGAPPGAPYLDTTATRLGLLTTPDTREEFSCLILCYVLEIPGI